MRGCLPPRQHPRLIDRCCRSILSSQVIECPFTISRRNALDRLQRVIVSRCNSLKRRRGGTYEGLADQGLPELPQWPFGTPQDPGATSPASNSENGCFIFGATPNFLLPEFWPGTIWRGWTDNVETRPEFRLNLLIPVFLDWEDLLPGGPSSAEHTFLATMRRRGMRTIPNERPAVTYRVCRHANAVIVRREFVQVQEQHCGYSQGHRLQNNLLVHWVPIFLILSFAWWTTFRCFVLV